ncbi:MAG: sensor histidine kinase [Acidimicrobiales bacterium]
MSLRLRLVLAAALVALVALVVADVATYSALRSSLYDRVDQTLSSTAAAGPFGPGPGPASGPGGFNPVPPSDVQRSAPGIFVERITAQGEVEYTYGAYEPGGEKVTPKLPASVTGPSGTGAPVHEFLTVPSTRAGGPQFRVLVTTSADGDRVIFAQPLDATAATLHQLLVIELLVTAGALLAAIVLGIWLVRVGLRPLQQVEETAEAITEGDLDRRVPGAEKRTEVGRLARVLNVMLARIQRAFAERDATEAQLRASEDRLRRFISDASHELRTPLAAVSAYAELYSQGASERPEDLGRVMRGIQSESARMKRLVEDLLLLARLDEGRPLEHEPVELVSLAADAVHAAAAVGPDWTVSLEAERPVEVSGDPGRLRQVLDNLLANVRAHTPPGTAARVSVAEDGDVAVVQVADSGPGLPVDEAPYVFERFFRADPSRSRASGGSGLGLSIVGAIVNAHGGTVSAANAPGAGALFTVRLPRRPGGASGPVAATAESPAAPS